MDIGTVKDQILGRIIHGLSVIHGHIFQQFFGADLIVGNNKIHPFCLPESVDHMSLLSIHASYHFQWRLSLLQGRL